MCILNFFPSIPLILLDSDLPYELTRDSESFNPASVLGAAEDDPERGANGQGDDGNDGDDDDASARAIPRRPRNNGPADFRRQFFPVGVAHRTGAVTDRARIALVRNERKKKTGRS